MPVRVALTCLAAVAATSLAQAAPDDVDAVLRSLTGQTQAAIERRLGLADEVENTGLQTFLRYRAVDIWRTGIRPEPFGYFQGFSGGSGLRSTARFDCLTTLVLREGVLRAFARTGSGCR